MAINCHWFRVWMAIIYYFVVPRKRPNECLHECELEQPTINFNLIWLRHQGTKNSILYFPDLEPVNYCQKNPEPMAIFITVTLTIIPTKSAINAAAKTNLVFLILTELE